MLYLICTIIANPTWRPSWIFNKVYSVLSSSGVSQQSSVPSQKRQQSNHQYHQQKNDKSIVQLSVISISVYRQKMWMNNIKKPTRINRKQQWTKAGPLRNSPPEPWTTSDNIPLTETLWDQQDKYDANHKRTGSLTPKSSWGLHRRVAMIDSVKCRAEIK